MNKTMIYLAIKKNKSLKSLLTDEDGLNMDILVIKEFRLVHDYWQASTGKEFTDDSSKIVICVK